MSFHNVTEPSSSLYSQRSASFTVSSRVFLRYRNSTTIIFHNLLAFNHSREGKENEKENETEKEWRKDNNLK
jgi:hypothetical protein